MQPAKLICNFKNISDQYASPSEAISVAAKLSCDDDCCWVVENAYGVSLFFKRGKIAGLSFKG